MDYISGETVRAETVLHGTYEIERGYNGRAPIDRLVGSRFEKNNLKLGVSNFKLFL